jgi:hypothetical protein
VVVAKCLRTPLSVAEFGREAIPCKDWPSATASGGCGLDKGLPPIDGENRPQAQPISRVSHQFQTAGFRRISDWR